MIVKEMHFNILHIFTYFTYVRFYEENGNNKNFDESLLNHNSFFSVYNSKVFFPSHWKPYPYYILLYTSLVLIKLANSMYLLL